MAFYFLLLISSITSKEVQICICQNLNCQQYAGCSIKNTLDPVNELTSKDFYDRIQTLMIGCSDINLIIRRNSSAFVPEMRLIQFSGKKVRVTESCLNDAPREGVKFQYTNDEDYSTLQLISINAKIIFSPVNNKASNLILHNFILSESSSSTVEFIGESPKISSNSITKTDNSLILSKFLIFNQILVNVSNVELFIHDGQCNVKLHENYFEYETNSGSTNVFFPSNSILNFKRRGTEPGIMFLSNVDINDYSKIPKFTTTYIDEIGISGIWPDPMFTTFSNLINIGDEKTDTKISVISEKVPFNFYARNLDMTIITSTVFLGQIEARKLIMRRTTDNVANVVIPKLISDLQILSPNISITVDDYTYTGYGIPATASFSDKHISKLTVNKLTTLNTIIDYNLNVFSFLTSQISSQKVVKIFEKEKDFLILPSQTWIEASDILVHYDQSSLEREGFTNGYNIVDVKIKNSNNRATFSFHLTSTPPDSPVEHNVCPNTFSSLCNSKNPIYGNFFNVSDYLTDQKDYIFTIYTTEKFPKFDFKSITDGEYNFIFQPSVNGQNIAIDIDSDEQSFQHIKSLTLLGDIRIIYTSNIYADTLNAMDQSFIINPTTIKVKNIQIGTDSSANLFLSKIIDDDDSPLESLVINAVNKNAYQITVKDSEVSFELGTVNYDVPLEKSYSVKFLTNDLVLESNIQKSLSHQFSIEFTQNSQLILNKFTNGDASDSKIQLNHGDKELDIYYDIGSNIDNYVKLNGHGYVSRNINYGTVKDFCLCYNEEDKNCQKCNTSSTKLYYDNIDIDESVHNVKITVFPQFEGDSIPVIPASFFANKKVEIDSLEEVTLNIKLDSSESINGNVKFTGKINIQPDSSSSSTDDFKLSILDLSSLEGLINNFNDIKLTVDKFYCCMSHINKFSAFYIMDEIKITVKKGDNNPEFEKVININEGSDFYDISIDFEYNINPFTFTFGDGCMKLGNIQFNIKRTEYIDIVVTADNFNFNVNLEKNADIEKVPLARFNMNTEFGGEVRNVYFNENWKESTSQILSFVLSKSVSFYFKSLIPMGIQMTMFTSHNFYINQTSIQNVGIQYGITIDQTMRTNIIDWSIHAGDDLSSSRTFCIKSAIQFIHRCERFQLISTSSKVNLLINNIQSFNSERVKVNIKLPLDASKASSLTIENTLFQVVLDEVLVEASIAGTVDIDNIIILHENVTIVNGRYRNLLEMVNEKSIKYVNKAENPAYATSSSSDIIGFTISDDQRKINLGRLKQLSDSTFVAQFEKLGNTEIISDASLVITDSRNIIPILSASLPKQVKSLYLYITDNLYQPDVIDFRQFSSEKFENKIDVVLDGVSLKRYSASIILGPIINTLTIMNINLLDPESVSTQFIEDKQINIDLIKFVDSSISANSLIIDGTIKNVETDADSFNSLLNNEIIKDSYQGKLKLTSSNYITFTKDGWIVRESSWKTPVYISSMTPLSNRIQLEGYDEITLLLDPKEEDMTEVKKPDLSILSTKGDDRIIVHIGTGWRKITNANELNINAGNYMLDIYSASYPLNNMFNTNNFSVSLDSTLNQQGNQVDFNLGDEYLLDKEQIIDMTSIENEDDRIIYANMITCSGSSGISFTEDEGHVRVRELIIEDDAYAQLPKTFVVSKIEMIESSILSIHLLNQPILGLDFKWRKNKMPELEIISNERIFYVPEITVIFNGDESEDDLNKTEYNNILVNMKFDLIRGNFDCEEWKKNAKFSSSIEKFSSNSGENCTFMFHCSKSRNNDVLQVKTVNLFDVPKVPNDNNMGGNSTVTDKDNNQDKKKSLSTGAVVGIALGCAVFAAVVCGLIVFIVIRRKYEKAMDDSNIELAENNSQSASTTNDG